VIASLESDFEPEELQSEYRRDLRAMLEAKLAGEEIARPEPEAEEAPVVDLMEALRKSVAEASKTKKASAAKPAAKKKTAARPRAKAGARKSA
jgi:DNA end-binding protein Ku